MRILLGIVVGFVVAFALVVAVEVFGGIVHPLPADFGGTQEEMCAHVARYPAWVLAVVVPLWAATALASTWLAGRIGGPISALVIGLLLVAAIAFNVSMLPYPLWFKAAELVTVPAAAVFAYRGLPRRERPAAIRAA